MASTLSGSASAATEFVLKTIAPRAPLHLLPRPRLSAAAPPFDTQPIVLVQAPAGYGKTSVLSQWRRENLARGVAVAWLLVDERDDAQRILPGLVHAMRSACARPTFGRVLLEGATPAVRDLEGATAWLAEVARLSLDIVLFVDDADRMPADGAEVLAYVLHNAPPNLRIVVAARRGLEVAFGDLLAYGQALLVGPEMLRFRLDETIALIGNRFGPRIDADACARLFEATDGWPLGLQLALAAMAHAADPRQTVDALVTGPGSARDQLVGALLAKLSPEDEAFLTRISLVDMLHPDLCEALTGDAGAPERLARLMQQTPVFITSEEGPWCRLHTLVRDALRERFAALDADGQTTLHTRALEWLVGEGMLQEAAHHALAAGQHQKAYELADSWLHDAVKQGHNGAVLDWIEQLPEKELERRPRVRLAAAWVFALGQRHEEARWQVERILAGPDTDTELRYECALILSAAAYYADEPDRFVALFEPWADQPPAGASWLAQNHANRLAARAILLGEPAQARRFQQRVPRGEVGKGHGYISRWGDHFVGLSYLWEGQLRLAEEVSLPALTSAEADLGRRHPLTCMFAAICAAISYEADRIDEAAALLANRLDVLERGGTPETVMLAYCTASRIAAVRGSENRALDLLEALHAMGVARRLPRLCIASIAEQVRIHASRYRAQTCDALVRNIDDIMASDAVPQGPLWQRSVALLLVLARARADLAARRDGNALQALADAADLAQAQKLGVPRIELMALRAFVLEQTGQDGRPLLHEAMNLAQTYDLTRTLADAHPALADWARRVSAGQNDPAASHAIAEPRIARPPAPRGTGGPRAVPGVVLTPKEREILELLARNLSNKEIAVAAAVGEGTVKWHLKNLFGKLDASSRKHAVRRALMLGLLEEG
ncbi:LuxR C-terminal-related transcriptional regulator [Paraburkholderia saeva]|uniref:LuxR C-terminal-related transcriptional regulator n=1 Tax=Paraburkholderia saeva TaxID=2777537 RepID=UPI001D1FF9EE|nr:LuxR C-terminal-related transcriptional regulator [Paraburkholderia saeva]CAG4888196.1 HTH-type transcriptional regulator MalT [Paraburkholderia saeva]